MSEEPTATIRIGTAADMAKYREGDEVIITISAADYVPPNYNLCTLPKGTAVLATLPGGGARLRSPAGVVFEINVVGVDILANATSEKLFG